VCFRDLRFPADLNPGFELREFDQGIRRPFWGKTVEQDGWFTAAASVAEGFLQNNCEDSHHEFALPMGVSLHEYPLHVSSGGMGTDEEFCRRIID
jgi:hypothetical protein